MIPRVAGEIVGQAPSRRWNPGIGIAIGTRDALQAGTGITRPKPNRPPAVHLPPTRRPDGQEIGADVAAELPFVARHDPEVLETGALGTSGSSGGGGS